MLDQIATIKFLSLFGYAVLIVVLLRSGVTPNLKLHFGLYLFGLGAWQLTSFAITVSPTAAEALYWYNLQDGAVTLQAVIFFPLTRIFLGHRRYRFFDILAYLVCAAAVAVGVLQLGVDRVTMGNAGYFLPEANSANALGAFIFLLFWVSGVVLLVQGYLREPLKLQKSRIGYIFVGAFIVIFGFATDFTPLQSYPADTVATLINALLVSYAVTRYRLLPGGIVLRRGLAVVAILTVGVFGYGLISIAASMLVQLGAAPQVDLSGIAAFLILLSFSIFLGWRWVRPIIDRLSGIRTVSHEQVIERFAQAARSVLDEGRLKSLLVETAIKTVGAECGCILSYDTETKQFSEGIRFGNVPLHFSASARFAPQGFIRVMQDRNFPLWEQELLVNPQLAHLRPMCEPFFERIGTSIAVPMLQEDRVVAILCVGCRTEESIYGTEDLHFLSTLANIAVSSITVAASYKEIQRQLSIQTFLFVLSEALVRNSGSGEGTRSAIDVLQSFLNVEQCYVLELRKGGGILIRSRKEVSSYIERQLRVVGREMAAGGHVLREDTSYPGALSATGLDLPDVDMHFIRSLAFLPLVSGEEWVGILALSKRNSDSEDRDLRTVVGAFRAILAQGLVSTRYVAELSAMTLYNDKLLESLSASGEMMFVLDSGGKIVSVNEAVTDVLGYVRDEITGRPFDQIVDSTTGGTKFESFLHDALSRVIQNREITIFSKVGLQVPVLISSARMEEAESSADVIVCLARDVSEQRALQRQLLHAQKMESIGTMAGGIAHDFNNMLTAAMGFIHLIHEEVDRPERVRDHAEIVENSLQRAAKLTQSLLSFARAGITERKSFSLNDLVSETVELIRRSFDRSIEIATDCAPELPAITGDRGQIHQMLMNLCVNARDAMPSGGVLLVKTSVRDLSLPARESADVSSVQSGVLLEVRDTGTGIPLEDLGRIFDPFFTTKSAGKGTGLGLSIVYGIVKSHGGRIEVRSTPTKGTTFEILFPVAAQIENPSAGELDRPQPARGRETILIVDDEKAVRDLLQVVLSKRGYRVLEAADGIVALETFKTRFDEIDLVVIDLIMPKIGGRETFLQMKALRPDLKALFATGYGVDEQTKELLSTGVLGIVRKPYSLETMEAEIRSVLDA